MFYTFVKWFCFPLVKIYLRLRVEQEEWIPRRGAALIVANHASFLDPIVLGSACPRKIHFIVLQSMYDLYRLRWFYWGMQAIPVRAEENDSRAIRQALRCLRRGDLVGIFPEGGRSEDGTPQAGKAGVALLAAVSGVPVVPSHIEGARDAWRPRTYFPLPGRVRVRFGSPLRFPSGQDGRPDRTRMTQFSEELMTAIARLAKEEDREGGSGSRRERVTAPGPARES